MAKAGEKEREFADLCFNLDKKMLSGKMSFEDTDKVYVSVDNSIVLKDKIILIEVDASNQAKLVTGQYVLLNSLKDKPSKKYKDIVKDKELVFFVVHFFGSSIKKSKYNAERSKKNFKLISKMFTNPIKYGSLHIEEFKDEAINTRKKFLKLIEKNIV